MMKFVIVILAFICTLPYDAICMGARPPKSDIVQAKQQEQMAMEATQQTGMPAIKNFNERKMAKMLFELRDQANLPTTTYLWSEYQGIIKKLCTSFGYGLPYSVQYTNPEKIADSAQSYGYAILPQADPNGLFMPTNADATWIMCQNPAIPSDVRPVYVEPKIIVSPFPLDVK